MAEKVTFRPYEPWHLGELEFAPAQKTSISRLFGAAHSAGDLAGLYTRTTFVGEAPRAVGGIFVEAGEYGLAWAFPDHRLTARQWVAGHRQTLAVLERAHLDGVRSIECYVRLDFPAGHKWAKMLGFSAWGISPARFGGDPHVLYGRTWQVPSLGVSLEAMLKLLERVILEQAVPRAAGELVEEFLSPPAKAACAPGSVPPANPLRPACVAASPPNASEPPGWPAAAVRAQPAKAGGDTKPGAQGALAPGETT